MVMMSAMFLLVLNQNDIALHTLVNKANFDCYMFHSLVRKILSPSIGNRSCIVNPHTGAIDHCLVLLSALQIEQYCLHVLYFTTILPVQCFPP
jgi:hypothetical protein